MSKSAFKRTLSARAAQLASKDKTLDSAMDGMRTAYTEPTSEQLLNFVCAIKEIYDPFNRAVVQRVLQDPDIRALWLGEHRRLQERVHASVPLNLKS